MQDRGFFFFPPDVSRDRQIFFPELACSSVYVLSVGRLIRNVTGSNAAPGTTVAGQAPR
jgi:hypothetical protein